MVTIYLTIIGISGKINDSKISYRKEWVLTDPLFVIVTVVCAFLIRGDFNR